ncbi:MAG: TolC family outer membrane protein [Betaproteobacteria bacterium]|nr:MAG: TolC family outer membrane protein [Betaproteobacteria bacterium]
MHRPAHRLAPLALLLASAFAHAQSATADDAMKAAAQKAIATSPDVTSRLNALRAAVNAIDVARGAQLPHLDLDARVGKARDTISSVSATTSYSGVGVTVSQLLWDGLAVRSQVAQLGHDKLARWFDLVDATEQAALDATRAHEDVLRFRRLVELAEDNYVQHRFYHDQIQSRFRAGVGRGVDLEQAAARVALAESNLTTETANLHDVTARYLRVVGELPPAGKGGSTSLAAAMPPSAGEAMNVALRDNAAISASIENLRSARSLVRNREAAYQPRIEARVRAGAGHNFDIVTDQTRDTTAEIVATWNLFNGGSDIARVRQQADLLNQAADLRDRACRDTRQTAGIAFNDTRKLAEQMAALDRNVLSIEKARDAYRQQFDIGQRSLLDLLNAENELYTAKRAYANADFDLQVAQLRTLAAMQKLTTQLGLVRAETPVADDAAGWAAGEDLPALVTTPRSELDRRAQQLLANTPQPPAPKK